MRMARSSRPEKTDPAAPAGVRPRATRSRDVDRAAETGPLHRRQRCAQGSPSPRLPGRFLAGIGCAGARGPDGGNRHTRP